MDLKVYNCQTTADLAEFLQQSHSVETAFSEILTKAFDLKVDVGEICKKASISVPDFISWRRGNSTPDEATQGRVLQVIAELCG